jgi:urocanate reductase
MKSSKNTTGDLPRRSFIKTAAVGAGATILGGLASREVNAVSMSAPAKWDMTVDVVVLGAGGAGMAAAIEANDAKVKVVVLEKAAQAGGSTATSGGIVYAAGTANQRAAKIADTPDEMIKFWMACGKGQNDLDLVTLVANESAGIVDWLTNLGNKWTAVPNVSGAEAEPYFAAITPTKARGHFTNGGGKALFKTLADAGAARGINILYETAVTELVTDAKGVVVGVKAAQNGATRYFQAKRGVVIATGGFPGNKEMLRALSADQGYKGESKGVPTLTGDGIRIAQALGADLTGASEICAAPSVRLPGAPGINGNTPTIFVNERGRRFANETLHYDEVAFAISRQEIAYVIFDDALKAKGGNVICSAFSKDLSTEITSGLVVRADTLAELAAKLNLQSDGGPAAARLQETLNSWNASADQRTDPEFGRAKSFGPIKTAPFYAVEVVGGMYDTTGGLRINTKTQVIDVFGKTIPRLYAASPGATGGTIGRIYPASGSALVTCFCLGRVAGKNAAAETQLA